MENIDTPEGRRTIYAECMLVIDDMVKMRQAHEAEQPGCGGAPLCMGPDAMLMLGASAIADPSFPTSILLVAIGELSADGRKLAELTRRLDVQRGITNDTLKMLDMWQGRAEVAEEAEQHLAAALAEKEEELAAAAAELTVWEESADSLSPAALPPETD